VQVQLQLRLRRLRLRLQELRTQPTRFSLTIGDAWLREKR
jgi:hypothetical protein